jgi:hypothetical protein
MNRLILEVTKSDRFPAGALDSAEDPDSMRKVALHMAMIERKHSLASDAARRVCVEKVQT